MCLSQPPNTDYFAGIINKPTSASVTENIAKCFCVRADASCADEELLNPREDSSDPDVMGTTASTVAEDVPSFSDPDLTQIADRLRAIGDQLEHDMQRVAPRNSLIRDIALSIGVRHLFRSAFQVLRVIAFRFSWR
jgi:hypothetical protein